MLGIEGERMSVVLQFEQQGQNVVDDVTTKSTFLQHVAAPGRNCAIERGTLCGLMFRRLLFNDLQAT